MPWLCTDWAAYWSAIGAVFTGLGVLAPGAGALAAAAAANAARSSGETVRALAANQAALGSVPRTRVSQAFMRALQPELAFSSRRLRYLIAECNADGAKANFHFELLRSHLSAHMPVLRCCIERLGDFDAEVAV